MALALGQALPPQPQAPLITFRPCESLVTLTKKMILCIG
jgi:hypothetical protein